MTGQLHQDGWDAEEFPTVVHAECLGQLEQVGQLGHEACEYSEAKVVATEMSEVLKVDKAGEDWEELGRTGKSRWAWAQNVPTKKQFEQFGHFEYRHFCRFCLATRPGQGAKQYFIG